ncbi:MAG: iron ABC transporter permease [Pseudomonadota bacterium]
MTGDRAINLIIYAVVALCLLPLGAAVVAAVLSDSEILQHLIDTVLPTFMWNTFLLVMIVALGTGIIGTGVAWLVTAYRFRGVGALEVLLALPLAFPAYVMAYAYTDALDHPGIVQATLRDVMGWGPRDYWFPEIRSLGGAAAMLIIVLYPYVYLLARAAFRQQSASAYLAARTLGQGPMQAFVRVALPMARPAIAGGMLLAVMETIADYGTVAYFSVRTFSTGIYQAWFAMADRGAAAQLAVCLLSFALLLVALERIERGRARVSGSGARFVDTTRVTLTGPAEWFAIAFCALPVLLGFVFPVVILVNLAAHATELFISDRYWGFMTNSLTLASVAAVVTVLGAVLISYRARTRPGRKSRALVLGASIGYAVPGGVIAVGLLVPFAAFDNALDAWMRENFGIRTGLLVTGSIWLLVIAYMGRFMAAALTTYDSGLETLPRSIDAAARTLGRGAWGVVARVQVPAVWGSALTALLIVFVDVMKELPATLILRPFNMDTLAVQAHRLAADERLEAAAVPSLVIVAFGLLPVILVCRSLGQERKTKALAPAPQPAM